MYKNLWWLMVNDWDSWFEWLNRVTLHSVQGDTVPISHRSRKEWLLSELFACGWYLIWERECMFRENLTGGMSMSVFGMATSSCVILYSMTRRASVRQFARVRQFRCSIMLLTLEVLWQRLATYLAALRCTCSNWVMSSLVYGSHTEQTYSSDGRTKDVYACSLTLVELMLMFLRRNPSVLFAFVLILFSVVFSGVRVTRSLVLCVCFVNRCLSFCNFSFGHCVVCPSSIYRFWLPLLYLQTLLPVAGI
jgi:hypothetical protein